MIRIEIKITAVKLTLKNFIVFLEVRNTYVDTIGGVVSFLLVHRKQNQSALIGRQLSAALKLPLRFLMQPWCLF